jgi:hypothetical protein
MVVEKCDRVPVIRVLDFGDVEVLPTMTTTHQAR